MKVNLNNVRKQAMYAYEKLVTQLNDAIIKNDQWAKPNDVRHDQDVNIKGYVLIEAQDLQNVMDNLRSTIGAIGFTYIEGNDDFKDVYKEIYPKEWQSMPTFNEGGEE